MKRAVGFATGPATVTQSPSRGRCLRAERRKRLPRVDPEALRRAMDTVVDASLS
jgi:hypothetical protein